MTQYLKKVSFVYMADTPWCGDEADRLYLTSGQFTSTIKDSVDVTIIEQFPGGLTYDGTNSPWEGSDGDKLYLQSGQFTSTLKTSRSISGIDTAPRDISWDGENTPWVGTTANKLYLQSGQFTATLKTSEDVTAVDISPIGISYDGENTPWAGWTDNKLYLTSGQFTSTLKNSEDIGSIDDEIRAISWDGTNTPWCGQQADKLYLTSGQFTSTIKTSEAIAGVDAYPTGICTNNILGRIGTVERSVIDSLTISDQVTSDIIRVPLATQVITDNLIINDGVLGYIDYIPVVDPLVITDIFSLSLNVISIIDYLAITDAAYQPTINSEDITDILTISDSISISHNAYEVINNLIIQQYVDLNDEIERTANNILTISDSIDTEKDFAFKIIDILTITDNIDEVVPRLFVVEDTLTITDASDGVFQYNIDIEDEFDITYIDTNNLIIYRIMDTVERHYTANRVPWNFLTVQQTIQVSHEKDTATEDSASNTLTITDEATVARSLGNSFSISDGIAVTQGKLIKDTLSITDTVDPIKELNKEITDNLILKLTVEYTHTKSHTHHEYAPFIGVSTDPNAPTPPDPFAPGITTFTNVKLSYPLISPTHNLILNGPELGDRDLLNYTRINRETRGGTLVIFADPNWPKREQFNLQFIGLSETESQEILNFLRDTLGKQIRLRDWKGNEYIVITLTPDNPIIRDGYCKNIVNLNFEKVYRVPTYYLSNSISFSQDIVLTGSVYDKSISSSISFGQDVSQAGSTFNKSLSNTISLGQDILKLYPRALTSSISLGQNVSSTFAFNKSISNTFSLGQSAVSTASIFDRSRSNTLTLGQTVVSAGSIFDRSLFSTISLGQDISSTPIYIRFISSSISLSQDVTREASTFNKLFSNTVNFDHVEIIDYVIDHGSLGGRDDDDHTLYLLADGSRDLTGNLAVDALVTIDGRDISVDGTALDATVAIEGMVGIDSGATPNYLGAASNDGVLRSGTGISYADGGDYITLTINDGEINHDSLTNTHNLTTDIDHDAITNYDANKHIDHTGITLTAGSGITGGGTIAANRTFDLDINSLAAAAIAAGDFVPFWDITATATNKKITFANFEAALDHNNLINTHNLTTDIDHDALTNFVANKHIDWTNASDDFRTSGNIGVGTTPACTIDVYHATAPILRLRTGNTNEVNSGAIDFIEKGNDDGFGAADNFGFRVVYDANDNKLKIKSGTQTTIVDCLTISRSTDLVTIANGLAVASGVITGANVTSGADPGHTHTGASLGSIDISADTNLAVTAPIVLTDDTLSFAHLGIESLSDPGGDRILFWDDSETACKWLAISTGLQISTTNLITKDSEIVHDNLSGYSANKHVDHTGVTLTAGSGLAGGGDISASRTFDLDINSLAAAAIAAGDFIPFWDITATATNKKITFANFEAALDHDSLTNTHDLTTDIDHDAITNTHNLNTDLDITGLAGEAAIAAADTIPFYDNGVGNKKITFAELQTALGATDKFVGIDSGATPNYLGAASNDGVLRTGTGLGYADGGNFITLTLAHLGIESLSDAGADKILFWDDGGTATGWLAITGTGKGIVTTNLEINSGYVDRGDPAAYDFGTGDFTYDNTWRDLDLSTKGVPAGAYAVLIRFLIRHDTLGGKMIAFRKKGNSNAINIAAVRTQVGGIYMDGSFVVACDANRVIQYNALALDDCYVTIGGWFI